MSYTAVEPLESRA